MKKQLLILALFLCSLSNFAAEWQYHYKGDYITGLSISSTSTWVGTYAAGLIEINTATGAVLHQYTKENSPILSNVLDWVEVDHNGVVWFAMDYVGIGKFDGTNWTFYTELNSIIKSDYYWQITIDNNNNVWVSTSQSGIYKYDGTNWTVFDDTNSPLIGEHRFVKFDSFNQLWTGEYNQILKYDGSQWTIYDQSMIGSSIGSTRDACFDQTGKLYVACTGLLTFDGLTWNLDLPQNNGMPDNRLRTVSVNSGDVWMGTSVFGVYKKSGNTWTQYGPGPTSYPDDYCRRILFPSTGKVFFASGNYGLVTFNGNNFSSTFFSNSGIFTDLLTSPTIDKNNLAWFYYHLNGIESYNGNVWTVFDSTNSSIPTYNLYGLRFDKAGNFWFNNQQELYKYDGINWSSYNTSLEPTPISSISEFDVDTNSNVWIADVNNGIYKFDGIAWQLFDTTNSTLNDLYFERIKCDFQNKIWTTGFLIGCYVYDGNWQHYTMTNSSIPSNNVSINFVDSSDNKWFTSDVGLVKFDGTNWTVFDTTNSSLPSNNINNVCQGGNALWIMTDKGLVKYDGNNWTVFSVYNSGLAASYARITADLNGNIWVNGTLFNENHIVGISEKENSKIFFEASSLIHNGPIRFNFNAVNNNTAKIILLSATGAVIHEYHISPNSIQFSIPSDNLPSGIYFANLYSNGIQSTQRIIIAK